MRRGTTSFEATYSADSNDVSMPGLLKIPSLGC